MVMHGSAMVVHDCVMVTFGHAIVIRSRAWSSMAIHGRAVVMHGFHGESWSRMAVPWSCKAHA